MRQRPVLAAVLLLAVAGLCACNTVAGVGRDISAAGSAVRSGAEGAKR